MMEEPKDGVVYPLALGDTFLSDSLDIFYHTLQCMFDCVIFVACCIRLNVKLIVHAFSLQDNFKPASIDTKNSSGVLRKNERGDLEVEIANKTVCSMSVVYSVWCC
jgi:hypothetical protein